MKKSKVIFLALLACAFGASARTVTQDEAARAARAWAARGTRLGARVGGLVRDVVAYNTNSLPAFYAVEFANGGGTVFTSADTENEPILAFAKDASARLEADSPLAALLYGRTAKKSASQDGQEKWRKALSSRTIRFSTYSNAFLGASVDPIEGMDQIDDVRVAPLVKTKWSQAESYSEKDTSAKVKCYDYYTPVDDVTYRYLDDTVLKTNESTVCGCVATAMAQVMKFWEYPKGDREVFEVVCSWPTNTVMKEYYNTKYRTNQWTKLSQTTVKTNLMAAAGAYDWADMTEQPLAYYKKGGVYQWFGVAVSNENCQAIGKLTYDCGVSVGMDYGISATGGSSISVSDADRIPAAMKEKFAYTNALLNTAAVGLSADTVSAARQKTILANLDAGCPVMLLITGSGGHAVVGDGYGYSGDENDAYVHLNMGWSGQCDVWYNLPLINTSDNPENFSGFNVIRSVVYNVFPTNAGEIVSGHVTTNDLNGVAYAVSNLVVTATDDLGNVYETTTSEYGVYAFVVPAGRSYRIYAELPGELDKKIGEAFTGVISTSSGSSVGNSWGNDLKMDYPTARIGDTPYVSLDRALEEVSEGDTVEILRPTELRRMMAITNDCAIVATNDNPAASAIIRVDGALLEVVDGVTVSVSNVAFDVEYETTVVVSTGGVLRVGGYCELGSVWAAAAESLVVASDLERAFAVCCTNAVAPGQTFAVGADGLDYLTASNCANKLLHATNTRLGGEAWTNTAGQVFFRWSNRAIVPDDAAAVRLNGVNYRLLADVCEDVIAWGIDADIVLLKDASLTNYFCGAHRYTFRSANGPCTVTPFGTAGFSIPEGGSLTISNLVFSGYRDANAKDTVGFIGINGGSLTLDAGAELADIEGQTPNRSGVIDVLAGTLTMRSGSAIVGCQARGGASGKGYGGAIYSFATNSCVLNLEGGTISNCQATASGGGIYVYESKYGGRSQSATVKLSGDMVVADNFSGTSKLKADNLCLSTARALPHFKLTGNLTGKVGVQYATTVAQLGFSGNGAGDPFVTNCVAGAMSLKTLGAFFNDTDASLMATNNATGDKLVWVARPPDNGQCDPDVAVVLLIDADGKTNYYESVERAFAYMGTKSPYVVEMLADDWLESSVAVHAGCDVTLRASDGTVVALTRGGDFGIVVPPGASLCLTNICISGSNDYEMVYGDGETRSKSFFSIEGGSLKMVNGAVVRNVYGADSRSANAITVSAGGTFVMQEGALIEGCTNDYFDVDHVASPGVGGGVLVDGWRDESAKSIARLHGGTIRNCFAQRGSAVYVCNGAEVHVSGAMRIEIDEPYHWNDFVVEDSSKLYLDDEASGVFNMADSVNGVGHDTNLIGRVTWIDWSSPDYLTSLTNSAAKFIHGVSGDLGTAATNVIDKSDVLLVWCGAVRGGQLYTNLEGKVYAPVADVSGLVTVLPAFMPLPELPSTADEAAVASALAMSDLADPSVAVDIKTLSSYNDFRKWAQDVDGGVDAVIESKKAGNSYKFGMTTLLTQADAPTVEIAEVDDVADGMVVRVVVKDGDDSVQVASDAVAAMFEATSDVSDWNNNKVALTVSDAKQGTDNSVTFKVVPAGNPSVVFIRLRY